MSIKNKFGETTSETNIDGIKQYCTYCEKYDELLDEKIFSTFISYLEVDKDNVEALFEDVYTNHITPTPYSANTLRGLRKSLLENSDWTVMTDSPLSDSKKTEWITYRQALRDITSGVSTEAEALAVTFPTQPESDAETN